MGTLPIVYTFYFFIFLYYLFVYFYYFTWNARGLSRHAGLSAIAEFLVTGRIAAKRQPASIKFTHRPKIRFFAPQERLVAPIHIKLGRADGHLGPLGFAKFHLNRHRGWECGPKNVKNFHFLERGDSLDRFLKILGAFIRLTMLH